MQKVIEEDKKEAHTLRCQYVKCRRPIKYVYCD